MSEDNASFIINGNRNVRHGDRAYFAGTGPVDKTCAACLSFVRKERDDGQPPASDGRCKRAADLRGCYVGTLKTIEAADRACKYFQDAKP